MGAIWYRFVRQYLMRRCVCHEQNLAVLAVRDYQAENGQKGKEHDESSCQDSA